MTRLRVTIIAAEKQYVLNVAKVCLHSCLSYTACSAHAPCCNVIFGLPGCTVFFTLSHKRHDFRKMFISQTFRSDLPTVMCETF